MLKSIGYDRFAAINWVQDEFSLNRILAEEIVTEAFISGKMFLSEDGVFVDHEDELKKQIISKKVIHRLRYSGKNTSKIRMHTNISTNSSNDAASMAARMSVGKIDDLDEDDNK